MINFDYNLLYPSTTPYTPAGTGKVAPRPPWDSKFVATPASELVKAALVKQRLIDLPGQKTRLAGFGEDYAELFALYNGLNTLDALAKRADAKGVSTIEARALDRRFAAGMKEVGAYVDGLKLDDLKLVRGEVAERARTATGVKRDTPEYRTGVVHTGDRDAPVAALAGDVKFQLTISTPPVVINGRDANGQPTTTTVASGKAPTTVSFDLAQMDPPGAPRTLGAVVNYLNKQLEAAGVQTRFEREKIPQAPRTVKVGDKTVTLPAGPDQWTLKLKGALSEALKFSAPASAEAVYIAQVSGEAVKDKPESQTRELLKFQSDLTTATAPPPAANPGGEANWVEGRTFSRAMDADIAAVRASATAADGSVYMLAELKGDVAGQEIKGEQDVALLKYDSAGQLLWSRTLGAADAAKGAAIAVSADGKVAIGGSVTGTLRDAGVFGPVDTSGANTVTVNSLNAAEPDSFVTVFDPEGTELWTRRGGAIGADSVKALAFGADGSVYAAGQSNGGMPGGGAALGGQDGWIRGWSAAGKESFTRQFGTAGTDMATALAVEGSTLVVAGLEDGRGVLRRFDLSTPGAATQTATRDLGDLMGGTVKGVALQNGRVVVAGTTRSGALTGTATNTFSGGRDAFVAALDGTLAAGANDRVSYWGGAGEDEVSAVAIRNGQAWITGATDGAIPNTTKLGDRDGFVARIDAETGAVGWTRRWTAKDGEAAPSAISVASGGASVLDRLGLPSGSIDYSGAQEIAASTSARAGDRFYVKVNGGRQIAVTLEARDTLKTLAERVNRALGFNARAEVTKSSGLQSGDGAVLPGVYDRLEIKPRNTRAKIELIPGEGGRDLLGALGLMDGVVQQVVRGKDGKEVVPKEGKTYGLKLARDLTLDSKAEIKRSVDEIATAMNAIRTAYRALADALKPPGPAAVTGTAPLWMQKQAANYQAALSRLTGGG